MYQRYENIKKQNFVPKVTATSTIEKKRFNFKSDDILLICLILVLIKEEKCDTFLLFALIFIFLSGF